MVVIKSHKEFESFFREFFPAVYAFLRQYTGGDEELSADLTQEAFVKVYERREEIESIEYAKAYLYTVARNLYWNHCKHQRAVDHYCAQLNEDDREDCDFLNEVTWQETVRILHIAINQLPPQARRVILLNLEGKNNNEVAETLQISVNTVKCLKKSAYVRLRGLLSDRYMTIFLLLFP
ncbi:MAG: sigma-70 family RNA polymerase sigma factor [Odoribacter sp.]